MNTLLECSKCKKPFNTSSNSPVIFPSCNHTVCKACSVSANGRPICISCTLSKAKIIGPNPLKPITNNLLVEMIGQIEKQPLLNNLNLLLSSTITGIETVCKIHKKPVTGYNNISMLFVCNECETADDVIYSIEQLVIAKHRLMLRESSNLVPLCGKINSLVIRKYGPIIKYFDENMICKKLSPHIAPVIGADLKLAIHKISTVFNQSILKIRTKFTKFSDLYDILAASHGSLKYAIYYNIDQCKMLQEQQYKTDHMFTKKVNFIITVNSNDLYCNIDKCLHKKERLDYKIKMVFIKAIEEITNIVALKEIAGKLEDIIAEEYSLLYK